MADTITLFRPVGSRDLALIAESDFRAFPPRLSFQPIFYPVLTEVYAIEIARDWNTKDQASGYAGFVTRVAVAPNDADLGELAMDPGPAHEEIKN
jgi:hypothetical protein